MYMYVSVCMCVCMYVSVCMFVCLLCVCARMCVFECVYVHVHCTHMYFRYYYMFRNNSQFKVSMYFPLGHFRGQLT